MRILKDAAEIPEIILALHKLMKSLEDSPFYERRYHVWRCFRQVYVEG